jgi:hypothetical protein
MLSLAILGGAVLFVVGALGIATEEGGWAAEAAAKTGAISWSEARGKSLDGRLGATFTFAEHNGKLAGLLVLAGATIVIDVAVSTFVEVSQVTGAILEELGRLSVIAATQTAALLAIAATSAAAFTYEHRAEIWEGIKKGLYYFREFIGLLADLLTIKTLGVFGAVKVTVIDWWEEE